MIGKSLTSSWLTSDSASCFCFPSAPYTVQLHVNISNGTRSNMIRVTRTPGFSSKKWELLSTVQPQNTTLSDEDKNTWEACRESFSGFQFTIEEVDKILGKAFGQIHSPYWGEERKKEVPKFETVNETLDYLRSLSLSDEDLSKLLKKFPEVLGCSLEEELKTNVQLLEKEWGIKGKLLKNLLLRNPKVLGYNVDCKGDCMAQCTRCWVRF